VRTAFVTGGAGFLGLNLVEQLVAAGWEVLAFDRASSPGATQVQELGAHLEHGDVTDAASCARAMPEEVDAVFHLAGNTSHWKLGDALQTKVNVEGTRAVAATALERRARRFVHTSSIAAYGFQPERITEQTRSTALQAPINYFRTKRLAEIEVHQAIQQGLDAVILNPANIVGPRDRSGWSRFFGLIERGRLPGVPPGRATFCHVAEVARAHITSVERGGCGQHYLLGGADASWLEFAQAVGALLGVPTPTRPTPAVLSKTLARLSHWASYLRRREPELTPEKATLLCSELICSSAKAERELGYRCIPLATMLEECHRWLRSEGLVGAS
jgi:nucleoside-diphosphate-sugar epimerase